jgi:hypothetical protein
MNFLPICEAMAKMMGPGELFSPFRVKLLLCLAANSKGRSLVISHWSLVRAEKSGGKVFLPGTWNLELACSFLFPAHDAIF